MVAQVGPLVAPNKSIQITVAIDELAILTKLLPINTVDVVPLKFSAIDKASFALAFFSLRLLFLILIY